MMSSDSNRRRRLATTATTKTNNIRRLHIDGFFFDSSAVAAMLRGDGSGDDDDNNGGKSEEFQSREIIFRNISIDKTVLKGARDLLLKHRNTSSTTYKRQDKNVNFGTTDIDIIHCSGLVSDLIRIVLPTTRRFGFAGNIPIAHNLDTEGLGIIGENLETTNKTHNPEIGNKDDTAPLKSLVLKGTRLESSGFRRFCDGLGVNTTLEELQLSTCILEEDDVILLASALRKNKCLKSIFFANCKFGTKARVSSNERAVETTQSINNVYPQTNLPIVLEALIGHPALESLKIYDMVCNEQALKAIASILSASDSKLRTLGLKNNLSHPRGKLSGLKEHLLPALSQNPKLEYLKLSGNNLNDEHMAELDWILTKPKTTIQTLSLSDNLIANGLLPLASRLAEAKSLRWLDVLRNPIRKQSKAAMVSALKNNTKLERLDLDGSWDEEKFWWLSLNRAGRRALHAKSVHASLWPTILERAYNIPIRRNSKHPSNLTNESVAYYLIRRIPWLFEKTSASNAEKSISKAVQGSRPEQKRQRERAVHCDSMEQEPKAKRMFNA